MKMGKKYGLANTNQTETEFELLLKQSAIDFNGFQQLLIDRGKNIRKIHAFNERLASTADALDMTPEEVIAALELFAKYMIMHANWTGGIHGTNKMMENFEPRLIAKEGHNYLKRIANSFKKRGG